jgi:hypothetical protein
MCSSFKTRENCPQEVIQSARTMLNEAEVTSSNLSSHSCADMSKKKTREDCKVVRCLVKQKR